MNDSPRRVLQFALPVLILGAGIAGAFVLAGARESVPPTATPKAVPIVEVVTATPTTWQARVHAHGSVQPATRSDLIAEVSGRVVEVGRSLAEGSFIAAGEVLVRIDPRDYEFAVIEARAAVAQAELGLALEQAEAESALREWQAMQRTEQPSPLVTREPQLAEARARVAAARGRLEAAERDVERCVVAAPYDGRVLTRAVDLGQFVMRNARLAQIYAIDAAEVRLPLRDAELAFLELDVSKTSGGAFADARGPEVALTATFGGRLRRWTGRIVRTEGQLDESSRMVNMIARVVDPYVTDGADDAPLLVNLFVDAEILGPPVADVFVLPRAVLRGTDRVWIVDSADRLVIRTVDVLRTERDTVVVRGGLAAGERVCVTPLEAVSVGMTVRQLAPAEATNGGTR